MRWRASCCCADSWRPRCRERANAGDGPYADKVATDVPQIEKALGVKFKTPPKLELRSREQVRDFLLAEAARARRGQKQIANSGANVQAARHAAGHDAPRRFLREGAHRADHGVLRSRRRKCSTSSTARRRSTSGITIMHELVHALQDQYVNLDSLEHVTGDDDRAAAVQAVIEGEATYEQVFIMAGGSGNLAAQLPGGWESMRTTIREAQQNAADLLVGADGDSGNAALSVHQRRGFRPPVQGAAPGQACRSTACRCRPSS